MDLENCNDLSSLVSIQTRISGSPESVSMDSSKDNSSTSSTVGPSSSKGTVKERRDLLNARLKGYKGEKLKRKLPVDTQLLSVSQEKLQIKRQLLEKNGKYGKCLL